MRCWSMLPLSTSAFRSTRHGLDEFSPPGRGPRDRVPRGDVVTTPAQPVIDQYSTGSTRLQLEWALLAAGKDLATLTPADLAMLEDFHTMGRFATAALV